MKEIFSPSVGQEDVTWKDFWKNSTPETEIRMWDYYGIRPWVLKFTPRYGKVLEAGCGLGRYNFLLSRMGIDIEGLDFEKKTISYLNKWSRENDFDNVIFNEGDVKNLPYESNSLSGYLSFGVIEHFIEGPEKPLEEAFRVLRPGGIAIITTPNTSWFVKYNNVKSKFKSLIKKVLKLDRTVLPFFQYEYSPQKLKKIISDVGLYVTLATGSDYLFTFVQLGKYKCDNIYHGSFAHKISSLLDNSFLRNFGSQSITISVKIADLMHCFICDALKAEKKTLTNYTVPICDDCKKLKISGNYQKSTKTYFHHRILINKEIDTPQKETCEFCSTLYKTDALFEKYGFNKLICPNCLKNIEINMIVSNNNLQRIFRKRNQF